MINRVLIRIKVVQLLYSYLLTEKFFAVETQPTPPTKASRTAYGMYLDMLALITRIAEGITQRGGYAPLLENRFVRALLGDEKVRSVLSRNKAEPSPLLGSEVVQSLCEAVKESAPYRRYLKEEEKEMSTDVRLWRELLKGVILLSPALKDAMSRVPEYTLRSADIMNTLLEKTFMNFSTSQSNIDDALHTLEKSLNLARELYMRLLLLPVELTELQARNLDAARNKYVVTDQDLTPNMRFVDNAFVKALQEDSTIAGLLAEGKFSWIANEPDLLASLLRLVTTSQEYRNYMEAESTDYAGDCEFWRRMLKYTILPSTELAEAMEDRSVFWNDDLDIIGTFLLKTVRYFAEGREEPVLPMYKDSEDARFGAELFCMAVKNRAQYRQMIDDVLNKESWESDRLAFMDVVVCITALAEILGFPKIPLQVSINEYIEIVKAYSTAKSGHFIHGILGAIVGKLSAEGQLHK